MTNKLIIDFQHFEGCPNGPKLLNNLQEALTKFSGEYELTESMIETEELAREKHFRGSPTILINGEDLEMSAAPESPSLSCRFYPGGLPTAEKILLRLEQSYVKKFLIVR